MGQFLLTVSFKKFFKNFFQKITFETIIDEGVLQCVPEILDMFEIETAFHEVEFGLRE